MESFDLDSSKVQTVQVSETGCLYFYDWRQGQEICPYVVAYHQIPGLLKAIGKAVELRFEDE